MSKMCSNDWHIAGEKYDVFNDDGTHAMGCEEYGVIYGKCRKLPDIKYLILHVNESPDGYITFLNCPQCGCTIGANDTITLDDSMALNERQG